MPKLHFDIRDIFRVVRLGWSGRKIWVGLCGLIAAYVGYSILVTVAHLTDGKDLSWVWHRYGLFPGAAPGLRAPLGTVIDAIATLYALVVILLTTCMICKLTYQQLRGDDFYSSGDAWKFLKSNWTGVLFGPIAVLALFVFFVIAGILIGLAGHYIPWAGELVVAGLFIPIFFAALVAVFISIALVAAVMMSPAIVGTVGEDALEVVVQSFSMVWSQPWRLLIYVLWMKISVLIGATILGALMVVTAWLINRACGWFMGEKLVGMYSVAIHYVPFDFTALDPTLMFQLSRVGAPEGSVVWAGYILAVMIVLLTGVLIAYVQASYASGISLIYVILRKRKDDENLLEWEEEDLGEEAPTPIGPEASEGEGPEQGEGEESASEGSEQGESTKEGEGGTG